MRVALVSTYPPRRCGLATFTSNLISAIQHANPAVGSRTAAIDEPHVVRAYGREVRWRIHQGMVDGYLKAAQGHRRLQA